MIPDAPTRHWKVVRYSHSTSRTTQLLSLPPQCFITPDLNKRLEVAILLGCSAVSVGDYIRRHIHTYILHAFHISQI